MLVEEASELFAYILCLFASTESLILTYSRTITDHQSETEVENASTVGLRLEPESATTDTKRRAA